MSPRSFRLLALRSEGRVSEVRCSNFWHFEHVQSSGCKFDPEIILFSLNLCLLRRGILLLSSSKIEVASANRCKIMCWKHLFDYSPQVVRLELKIPKTENGSTATPSEFSGVEHTFTTKGYVLAFIHLWVRGLVGARGGTRGTFPLVGAGVFSPWLGLRH